MTTTSTKVIKIVPQEKSQVNLFERYWSMARDKVEEGERYSPYLMSGKAQFWATRHDSKETWLAHHDRTGHECLVSATNASVILGLSSFQSPIALWKEKVGQGKKSDLSNNPYINRGIEQEPIIRNSFCSHYANEFELAYFGNDILHHPKYPFITCTLDGMLYHKGDKAFLCCGSYIKPHAHIVLEIKTGSYATKAEYLRWKEDELRDDYLAQVCQQLAITGFDYAIVLARLFRQDREWGEGRNNFDLPLKVQRVFLIERTPTIEKNIKYIIEQDKVFYRQVCRRQIPTTSLKL